jgi:hypothetical protein
LGAAEDIVYVTSVSWGGMERWLAWFVGPPVWFALTAASQRLDLFCRAGQSDAAEQQVWKAAASSNGDKRNIGVWGHFLSGRPRLSI